MDRPHPIQVATLILVGLATIFAFVAMRVAFDARDAARSAASNSGGDASGAVYTLQDALVRAGVIDDPWFIPDDHGELGGPWARCLTVAERTAMGATGDDAPLPDPPCDSIVIEESACDVPEPDPDPADDMVDAAPCAMEVPIDGHIHQLGEHVRPDDVDADATAFFTVTGAPGIDRYVQGSPGYLHLVGWQDLHGWYAIHPVDW